ncbi:MAG: hypothetical protein HWN67_15135 [Candidatus Helarchaeota archaeon]|nr:hypothetical protein [Candidatus Helarchaeota archaeon]
MVIDVTRTINFFYYLIILIYLIIVLVYIYLKNDKNAINIFIYGGFILFLMEFFGQLTGIRFIVFNPIITPWYSIGGTIYPIYINLIFALIMGFGEGGASCVLIYYGSVALYKKKWNEFFIIYILFFLLMLSFVLGTFLLKGF